MLCVLKKALCFKEIKEKISRTGLHFTWRYRVVLGVQNKTYILEHFNPNNDK